MPSQQRVVDAPPWLMMAAGQYTRCMKKPASTTKKPATSSTTPHAREIFRRLQADNPQPRTELEYASPYQLLVAVVLSALERHDGNVPADGTALEALPGVGHKTANVLLNTLFHQPVIAVDTHIFRVANRTGLAPGRNVQTVEAGLLKSVPPEFLLNAHHWLILLGRYTCKARKPECSRCPILALCPYPDKPL